MQGKPDGFETVLRMGNNLGKSGQFLHHAENGKWSGKIRTVETLSGKWEMIWKNPDIFETNFISKVSFQLRFLNFRVKVYFAHRDLSPYRPFQELTQIYT